MAFKAALRQELGSEKLATQLFNKLELGGHKPLTERRIETAAKYAEQVAAVQNDPMVGRRGKTKFLSGLFADRYTRPTVSKTMQEKMRSGVPELKD